MNSTKPPIKGWYWHVEPAKYIYSKFLELQETAVCIRPTCQSVGRFCKDSNGKGNNVKACFRCSVCSYKLKAKDFFVQVLGRNLNELPPKTPASVVPPPATPTFSFTPSPAFPPNIPTQTLPPNISSQALLTNIPAPVFSGIPAQVSITNGNSRPNSALSSFQSSLPPPTTNSPPTPIDLDISPPGSPDFDIDNSMNDFDLIAVNTNNRTNYNYENSKESSNKLLSFFDHTPTPSIPRKRSAISQLEQPKYITEEVLKYRLDSFLNNINTLIASSLSSGSPTTIHKDPIQTTESSELVKLREENALLKEQISLLTAQAKLVGSYPSSSSTKTPAPLSNTSSSNTSSTIATTWSSLPTQKTPSTRSTPNSSLPLKKPTFAEIAKSQCKEGSSKDIEEYQATLRKIAGVKPLGTGTKAEATHKVARLYVQGISRQPIGEVKKSLFTMKFKLSKIWNLDFIGKSTLEFTVAADYASGFVGRLKSFPFLSLLSKVNPSKPIDTNVSEQVCQNIKQAFLNRIRKSFGTTTKPLFQAFLKDLALETGIPLDFSTVPNLNSYPNSDELVVDMDFE
ncbi:hypothetical protein BB559_007556 [Furculomyces boomerangus]|uniref:Uncharacterized protein n=1 Tax=Furculomyces boomerangus TaxID=61424 RepID=A0A2T9XWY5_9FUNG|nr:hypothetical protein BB559_007556 [Furculomyces boomerangus]